MGLEDQVRGLQVEEEEKKENGGGGGRYERRWARSKWSGESASNMGIYNWEIS